MILDIGLNRHWYQENVPDTDTETLHKNSAQTLQKMHNPLDW